MKKNFIVCCVCMVAILTGSLHAAIVPGRWEKVDSLSQGTPLTIVMRSGDRFDYAFQKADATSITVRDDAGREHEIAKAQVHKIVQPGTDNRDRTTLIGALVGAGAGIGTGIGISKSFDETFFARTDLMALTCGAIGAVSGAFIGRAVGGSGDQLLFQAP